MPDNWGYKTAHKAQLKTIMANPCAIDSLIFEDLYDGPQAIADDATERSILVQKLKQQGFHQTGWGRGNWMEGPRIVAYAFANDQCTCSVYKLYYSPEIEGKCRVAEEIHCSDKK